MNPKISVIIPTYNREKVVLNTLNCVINQTFEEWECIVVDDFSTDSTYETLLDYAKRDSRIRIFRNERTKGACGARNTGLSYAKAELVQFFDSDDEMSPEMLAELFNSLRDDADVVTCWTNVIDVDTGETIKTFENITKGHIHSSLLSEKTYVDTNCALIRKNVVERIEGWSEDCPSFQEWDFHLRLSKIANYSTLRKHLIRYYVGGSDIISKSLSKWVAGRLYIINKNKKELLLIHPIAYLKKMLYIYYLILKTKDDLEKNKSMKMYIEKTDSLTRLMIKFLNIPYSHIKNERK